MIRRFIRKPWALSLLFITGILMTFGGTAYAYNPGDNCGKTGNSILGFPTWYKYLNPQVENGYCKLDFTFPGGIAKVLLALVEIALRVGGLVAVGFIIYGGFKFILSNGEPDRAAGARQTIINALVGLVIAILATGIVSFLGGAIK